MDVRLGRDSTPTPWALETTYQDDYEYQCYSYRGMALASTSPNYQGPVASLSSKRCDHYSRGCPHECDSNKELCARCERGECSQFHT
ncbi:hypothetical protein M426DRAFT_318747 [Hypoxylon sp. CI-4A]|nr:hypothetical protein M426DRAFT_318747 [Hypoxylon sp. CI-4A]